ncbi:MAG: ABC transporter permease [Candidatus Nomurabacteria bacterium]|nr:ABC transporter permease [Candidatus Nomurabacteria bacterium]
MLKRSALSTVRKPSRTVILALILFVMANLMLSTIAIKGAVGESIKYAKETLGGVVYLQPDMESMRSEMSAGSSMSSQDMTSTHQRMERPSIDVEAAKSLADSKYVKDYTYSVQASANASNYTLIETEESSMRSELQNRMGQNRPEGTDGAGGFSFTRGDTQVIGINSFAFISDVETGNMKLSSGEIFDESTADGVMISADLANANNLKSGSEIKLKTTSDETEVVLKVVGIYDNTNDSYDPNTIYGNIDVASKFISTEDDANVGVQSVKYYLVNAEDKDAFIAEATAKYPNMADDYLKLDIDTSAYDQMIGPIESVGSFATTILWIVIVASVVIITLIVTINVKDRRYEMGVLMSLGASKVNILGQVLLELVVVGTVAFALSVVPSAFIASAMGDGLLKQQISMSEQTENQGFGRGESAGPARGGAGGGFGGMQSGAIGQANTQVDTVDEINVSASVTDYAVLFAAGYAVLILAMVLPTANVLRFEPKTILTGKE